MEIKEISETLEEGLAESKLNETDVPSEEIVQKGDSVCLSNLNEKCVADVHKLESEINNVELASKFGSRSVEESVVFDGIYENKQLDKGCLISYADDKLSVLTRGDDINDKDVVAMEGDWSGNDGVQIGNVDQPVNKCGETLHSHELVQVDKASEKDDHVLHPHEPGSPTKIEVSGNSINLFVEVFGPLNGVSDNEDELDGIGEHKLGESESNEVSSVKENGAICPGVKDVSAKNEGEDIVGELDCTFNPGDLIWVKTQTKSWWPGMISGSPSAVNNTTEGAKRVRFLVQYFASSSLVWCDPIDLKPFVKYFAQMSGHNNKKNFIGAIEKALCEIGRRAKSVLTCPCYTKESQILEAQWSSENKEEFSVLREKPSESDVSWLSQFEPATFCAIIKQLACSVQVPGKIELTVMKNQLSSFYCSIGHHELPLQQLRSDNDAAQDGQNCDEVHDGGLTRTRRKKRNHSGDESASSAKGLESRERKKSKYLSYPYVDVNQGLKVASTEGQEEENPNHPSGQNAKCTPLSTGKGVKSRRKGTKKPVKGRHIVSKADNIDACSSELLAELCSTARDCFYLEESKYSDSLNRFFCSFRECMFLNVDTTNLEKHLENSGEAVQKKRRYVKKSQKQKVDLASVEESVGNVVGGQSSADNSQMKENVKRRGKKRKEQATNSQTQMEGIVVKESENQEGNDASTKESVGNAVGDEFSETVKENGVCSKAKKKKEQVISAGLGSILNPFSTGSNIFASSSGMINFEQAHSNVHRSGTTPEMSMGAIPGLADINSVAKLPYLNRHHPSFSVERTRVGDSENVSKMLPKQGKEGLVSPTINVVNPLVFTSIPPVEVVPVILQSRPKSSNSVNGTNQNREPRSNVINSVPSSFAQYTLQLGVSGSAGKLEPRKRKRKEKTGQVASAIPDLNGNVSDMSSAGSTMAEGSAIPPPVGEQQKKKANKSEGEAVGGTIILNFVQGSTLPSEETLVATFSRYGLLKKSELKVLDDARIQVVYERISDARFAHRSLERCHPFGESLVNFTTDCMPPPLKLKRKHNPQLLQTFVPVVETSKTQMKPSETPDSTAVIKQKVEKMKKGLEEAGSRISPEMRAKLENEIKTFLDKLSNMSGSSSS